MTTEVFLMLLASFSTLTGLCTEALKRILDTTETAYASNLLALASAAIVGGFGTIAYYFMNGVEWNAVNIVCIFLMIIANWLGAQVGYDKIKQLISQFKIK